MKTLERKVHFVAEGTSVGCYDSKGNPMHYLLIDGTPFIRLDDSVDRLVNIPKAATHSYELPFYRNYDSGKFARVDLTAIINRSFVNTGNSHWNYAERPCTHRELASFYLAMYKVQKNFIKMEVKNG